MSKFECFPFGESAIKVVLGDKITEEMNQKVTSYYKVLKKKKALPILDIVPSYTTLTIYFNGSLIDYATMKSLLVELWKVNQTSEKETFIKELIWIPTYYGGEFGPDIEKVAIHNNISVEELVRLHSSVNYLIYMMGFLPGFPYLGGLPNKLTTPRLEKPRDKVEEGSVGIAEMQTGIYPISSPGGWNIIGRTPLKLFETNNDNPFLLKMGQYLRFYSVSLDEYQRIETKVNNKEYSLKVEVLK